MGYKIAGGGFYLDHLKCFKFFNNGNKYNDCDAAHELNREDSP